jgi:hypothetical protein
MFVAKSIHKLVNNWSLVHSCKYKNVLKCFSPCFFSKSKYILYNLTQQILTIMAKSYTYMSQVCANLMITWIASNNGSSQLNPITLSISQRYQRFIFVVVTIIFKSSFIITTRIMSFYKNPPSKGQHGDPPSFYLQSFLKPLVLSSLVRMHFTRCFKEKEKLGYM